MNKKDLSNAIRFLSLDAVEKAKSGHPGAPMGMADIAYVLWSKFLKHNPSNPKWLNRDRFVLIKWAWLNVALFASSFVRLQAYNKGH